MNNIFWAGDSTVQTNDYTTYPQNGIGQVFSIFLKESCSVFNHAKNGRSTKSFLDEGRLESFIDNLGILIQAARERRAYPVLITPLERRCFTDEKHLGPGEHLEYVKGIKEAAEKFKVPLVDLYTKSRRELEKAGEERSRGWYMYFPEGYYPEHPAESKDNTHLRHDGAVHFAGLIAEGLRELGGVYADLLIF